jgi:hypothetical protein
MRFDYRFLENLRIFYSTQFRFNLTCGIINREPL